jgi:hypothetical protein
MTPSERIGHALVALPIAHVLGASLFLWSYCIGFGSNLVAHATVSDLLSVSIGDMVLAYLLSFGLPVLMVSLRLSSKHPYASDFVNDIEDDAERAIAAKHTKFMRLLIIWIVIAAAAFTVGYNLYLAMQGERVNYIALQLSLLPASTVFLLLWSERASLSSFQFEALSVFLVFAGSLFFGGLTKGDADRWRTYKASTSEYTMCGDAALIRSVSSNFLAVLPGDQKAIVSPDCKVKYRISTLAAQVTLKPVEVQEATKQVIKLTQTEQRTAQMQRNEKAGQSANTPSSTQPGN